MNAELYEKQYAEYLRCAENALKECADVYLPVSSDVCQAARYSLFSGGKRVRAILTLAVCDMLRGNMAAAADFSAAVEMLHCYSLIHDDLPCMDDDDFRRGKPSCHKAFGEATATLAGDVLLTEAFEVIAQAKTVPEQRMQAIAALTLGGGSRGMILGQELDIYWEQKTPARENLDQIHHYKTGALINAAVQMGACAAGAGQAERKVLEEYAFDLGLVFQIVDDVLDVTSTSEQLGKPIGSDAENGKVTFATLYGVEGAMQLAREINRANCTKMEQTFGERAAFLIALAETLLLRDH